MDGDSRMRRWSFRERIKATWLGGLGRYLLQYGPRGLWLTVRYVCSPKPKLERLGDLGRALEKFGGKIYLPGVLEDYDRRPEKKVLVLSHELELTGAPVALRYLVLELKREGMCPVVASPKDGPLADVLAEDGVPVLTLPILMSTGVVRQIGRNFDLVVANTIVTAPLIQQLDAPVIWWVHEAQGSYVPWTLKGMPQTLPDRVSVYAVGPYAGKVLKDHRPDYRVEELLYCVPDRRETPEEPVSLPETAQGKTVFCLVGTLVPHKGQDILVRALDTLPRNVREKGCFVFVGAPFDARIAGQVRDFCHRNPENALYLERLSQGQVQSLYRQAECLICASRQDCMPMVVTEAMAQGMTIICSENTGSAPLLAAQKGGLIYENDSPEALARCVQAVLEDPEAFREMGSAARRIYESYFSESAFRGNCRRAVEKALGHGEEKA